MLASSFPLIDIHVKNGVPVTNRHVISVIEHDAEHIVLNVPILSVLAHLGWNFISDKTNCYLHGIVLSILATDTAIALPNLRQLEAWSSFHTSDVRAPGIVSPWDGNCIPGWTARGNSTTARGLLGSWLYGINTSKQSAYSSPLNCESHPCKIAIWSPSTPRKATPIPMLCKTEATLPRAVNVVPA